MAFAHVGKSFTRHRGFCELTSARSRREKMNAQIEMFLADIERAKPRTELTTLLTHVDAITPHTVRLCIKRGQREILESFLRKLDAACDSGNWEAIEVLDNIRSAIGRKGSLQERVAWLHDVLDRQFGCCICMSEAHGQCLM
jgi:hypothetical protein